MRTFIPVAGVALIGALALAACEDRDLASNSQSQIATETATPADSYTGPPPPPQAEGAINESLGTTGPTEPDDAPPTGAPATGPSPERAY